MVYKKDDYLERLYKLSRKYKNLTGAKVVEWLYSNLGAGRKRHEMKFCGVAQVQNATKQKVRLTIETQG